jgi:ribosomal protein L29
MFGNRKQNLLHELKSKQDNVVNERFKNISEELKNQNRIKNRKEKPKIFINN